MKSLPVAVAVVSSWTTAANAMVVYGVYTYHENIPPAGNTNPGSFTTNCDYCGGPGTYTGFDGLHVVIENGTYGSGGFGDDRSSFSWSLTVDQLGQPVSWDNSLYESFGVGGDLSAEETNLSNAIYLSYNDLADFGSNDGFDGWVYSTAIGPPGSWTVSDLVVTPDPVVTPLPATLPLLGLGFATLAFARRRHSR